MRQLLLGRGAFIRMLSGAVAVQALLSASSFIVGLLLIRRTNDTQYGYYVLITTAILLTVILQGAFIQPPMTIRLTRSDKEGRSNLVGSLRRDQSRFVPFIAVFTVLSALALQFTGRLSFTLAALLIGGTAAVIAVLYREFLRMVLFAYRRPNDILKADVIYSVLLVGGAFVATLTPLPAAVAALTMAISALVGGSLLSKALWRYEPWNPKAPTGMLREIAPQGAWSAFGGCVHWLFSQGYNYLVVGTLDVTAVAALAATRLLVMPVGLLSTGIGTLMLPTVSKWTNDHAATTILRRLTLFATGLAAVAVGYLLVMWLARDWIFTHVLKKSFAHRDLLLTVWSVIALITVFRDQLIYFLVARARFRLTSSLTLMSAIISFSISIDAMHHIGVAGALLGLLAGELFNVLGIIVLSLREASVPSSRQRGDGGMI